jgi:fatty acid desaturase
MRFWFSGPRIFGVRPGVSFGREDFKRFGQKPAARRADGSALLAAATWTAVIIVPSVLFQLALFRFAFADLVIPNAIVGAIVFWCAYRARG